MTMPVLLHIDPSMDHFVLLEGFDVDTKRVVDVLIGWVVLAILFFGGLWWYYKYHYMRLPSTQRSK